MDRNRGARSPKSIGLLVAGVAVCLIGIGVWSGVDWGDRSVADEIMWPPTPESVQDLVAGRDGTPPAAIVVGFVQDVAFVHEDAAPTPDATVEMEVGATLWPHGGDKTTYLRLLPEEVLFSDGSVRVGEPILLAMAGTYDEPLAFSDEYPAPEIGERFLFFLRYDEPADPIADPVYEADRHPYSRLIIDGDEVTYSDGEKTPVAFAAGMPPSEFVAAVATAVAAQYP